MKATNLDYPTREKVFKCLSRLYPSIDFDLFVRLIPDMEIFVYGGLLRDLILKRQPKEADIVIVSDSPMDEFEMVVENALAEKHFTMLGKVGHEDSANYHYLPPEIKNLISIIDINLHQKIDLDHPDTDFTINSLYMNLSTGILSDPCHGLEDMRAGILRSVRDPRTVFGEHPLLISRAIKCICQFEFEFDPATKEGILVNATRISETMNYIADHRQTLLGEWMLDNVFRGLAYNPKGYFSLHQELNTLHVFLSFVSTRLGYDLKLEKSLQNPFIRITKGSYERNLSIFLSFLIDRLSVADRQKGFAAMLDLWGFALLNKYHNVGVKSASMEYLPTI